MGLVSNAVVCLPGGLVSQGLIYRFRDTLTTDLKPYAKKAEADKLAALLDSTEA